MNVMQGYKINTQILKVRKFESLLITFVCNFISEIMYAN